MAEENYKSLSSLLLNFASGPTDDLAIFQASYMPRTFLTDDYRLRQR
jgi:hypothetical protein